MKIKLSALLAALLISTNVAAEEPKDVMTNLTLAAAETGSAFNWTNEKPVKTADAGLNRALELKALDINEEINAKLEKALEDKLSRELNF